MLSLSRLSHRIAVKSRATCLRLGQRFRAREDGVAAVEFALIVPIMATMMLGSIEMSEAVTIDRRVSQVAATTGDLAARFDGGATPADISEVSRIGSWILGRDNADRVRITLSLVTVRCQPGDTCNTNDTVPVNYAGQRTRWECVFDPAATGNAAQTANPGNPNAYRDAAANAAATCTCRDQTFVTPSTGLVEYNTSPALVVSDVLYRYTPMFYPHFMLGSSTMTNGAFSLTERLYHKPRGAEIKMSATGSTSPGPNTCNAANNAVVP